MKYTLFRQVIYFRLADDLYKKWELKENSRYLKIISCNRYHYILGLQVLNNFC
jgi:hypothetical protein